MRLFSFSFLNTYWSISELYDMSLWSSLTGRNRFQSLLRFFQFANNSVETENKLYKIRATLNYFNDTMKNLFIYLFNRPVNFQQSQL